MIAPTPCIWINGSAREAAEFYASVFRDTRIEDTGPAVNVWIHGRKIILLEGDDTHAPNPSISALLNFDPDLFGGEEAARAYLREVYEKLNAFEMMPLGEYPFSPYFSWIADKYGFTWQLMLTNPDGPPAPFLTPALMFGGVNHLNAREAADYYIEHFGGERVSLQHYPEGGEFEMNAIMFTSFTLGGELFAAMDSGDYHQFTFSPGVSLTVFADDQVGIDRHWAALSAKPEAERCGWCTDRWGVSWQVLPAHLGELLSRPGAVERMRTMAKLEIDRF